MSGSTKKSAVLPTRNAVKAAFGRVLKDAREAHRKSQVPFSESVGISATHLSLLERGCRSPSLAVVFALAAGLKMKPEVLVMQTRLELARMTKETAENAQPDTDLPRKPVLSLGRDGEK
jgi:transcriptional regulator with XRE-family HTH domain